ncbi:MAG: BrnT family toxin [Bradyrhizobium sp.]
MSDFEWDPVKDGANRAKHGVGFEIAQRAFLDPLRVIAEDLDHSGGERRYFCFGRVKGAIMTVLHLAKSKDQDFRSGVLAERTSDL